MARHYKRTRLVNGLGSLKSLGIQYTNGPNGQTHDLSNGDSAQVELTANDPTYPNTTLVYIFDSSASNQESLPLIIRPVDFNGTGVWKLASARFNVLTADNIVITNPNNVIMTLNERTKLNTIQAFAEVNPQAASAQELLNGTETNLRLFSPEGIKTAAIIHARPFQITSNQITLGTDTALVSVSPANLKLMIETHSTANPSIESVIVAGTSRTLTSSDNGKRIIFNSSNECIITLPQQTTENLPDGFNVLIRNKQSGDLILETQGSDILIGENAWNDPTVYSSVILDEASTPNTWVVIGNMKTIDQSIPE